MELLLGLGEGVLLFLLLTIDCNVISERTIKNIGAKFCAVAHKFSPKSLHQSLSLRRLIPFEPTGEGGRDRESVL